MPILTEEARSIALPRMHRVRQTFDAPQIEDAAVAVAGELARPAIRSLVRPGARVAVAVGSRGIRNIDRIARAVVDGLKALGASPFIVPAMGSHGGASAEGQRELLARYGVSEQALGVSVVSSMATTVIAETADGVPIHFSSDALAADLVVPIARVKPHTDFRGRVESGLCKMLAIGLAKHAGCSRLHREGFPRFSVLLPQVASRVLERTKVGFGIAIVENAYDETARVEAVPAADFLRRDAELLIEARRLMARILLPAIDVLVVEQIGKDISGAGMDPNIMGRTVKGPLEGYDGPEIKRIIVLGLTEATHGNAIGIGAADFTLDGVVAGIDREAMYANSIAAGYPESGRIPIALADEAEAIRAALGCTPGVDLARPRVVRIRNTLDLRTIEVSEALLDDVRREPRLAIEA
jgi:hypothetical protein